MSEAEEGHGKTECSREDKEDEDEGDNRTGRSRYGYPGRMNGYLVRDYPRGNLGTTFSINI
jgi:hypothetical protein